MSLSVKHSERLEQAPQELVCLGVITGARGLNGQVWVRSFTSVPEDIGAYGPVYDEQGTRCFQLCITGGGHDRLAVHIDGIEDRTSAEALKGTKLCITRSALPPADEDEYYFADLIGLDVYVGQAAETGDVPYGRVRDVQDYGAGAVLEICGRDGRSTMVPFTRPAVPVVDLEAKQIVIAPLPGLFSPNEAAGTNGGR